MPAAPAAQDREVAKRWEELAEFRHQQLLLEEAQMLQMQEIHGSVVGCLSCLVLFLFWEEPPVSSEPLYADFCDATRSGEAGTGRGCLC